MNYRHIYHAGNFADVIKHVMLVGLLEQLQAKPKGLCYFDTHAGIGLYDLDSEQAQKTEEYRSGIAQLMTASDLPPLLQRYLALVRGCNSEDGLRHYPGSPWLARQLLREQDRAVLFELHQEDAAKLKLHFARDPQVAVHADDGYRAVRPFLPPKEGRGLLLMDPPFEAADEFERMIAALVAVHRAWRGGVFGLWYPLKDPAAIRDFHAGLVASGIRKILLTEVAVLPEDVPNRLNGSGMIIVNPPWRFDAVLDEVLPVLGRVLGADGNAEVRLRWLVPE